MAERVRHAIENLDVETSSGFSIAVTASFGVSSLTPELSTSAMWFAAADIALYQAKRSGRNRVVSAEPGVLAAARPKAAMTDRVRAQDLMH